MKQLMMGFIMAVSVLMTSCASDPNSRTEEVPGETVVKQCSSTPQGAISTFLQGIKELSFALLRAVIPEESSLYGVFGNNDERRGREVIRQISAHPEISGEGGSCACEPLSVTDTVDRNEKIVVVKRVVVVNDDLVEYKRAFRVRFGTPGNCILTINPIDQKWERI
ncbi:MAG: hypothetical protein Q7S34_02605 [bacterium]|nr:hypothetical protein [bacterium]